MRFIFFLTLLFFSASTFAVKKYKLVEFQTNMGIIKVRLFQNTPKHSENFLKLVKEKHYDSLLFHRVIPEFMIQGGASDSKGALSGKMVGLSKPGYTIEAEINSENHHVKGALAAARQGDEVNPEKRSSPEQFYIVQGKVYTDKQLDQMELQKLMDAKNKLGKRIYQSKQPEHRQYLLKGQQQKADSLKQAINAEIERSFAGKNPYHFTPEVRELYKSVGGTPFLDGDYTVFGEIVEGMDVLDKIAAVKTDRNDRPVEDVVIITAKLKRK